ncbi:hypothetical protein COD67_23085 [Bacillus cereus]|nr:hypothetical protein COI89_21665 [Bacillus cereus]PGU62263.1 hypothetical protein COD67_23085 [Bacillus cereus]
MSLTYFSDVEEEQDFILDRYADEIRLRTEWIIDTATEINSSLTEGHSASSVIRKTMDLIGHAIVILRIVDPEGIGARRSELDRTKERVRLIRKKWPEIPI